MIMIIAVLILLILSLLFIVLILIISGKKKSDEEYYEEVRNPFIMQILVPRENEKASLAAEQMFASIHGILEDYQKCPDVVSFEIASSEEHGIKFYVVAPEHLSRFIEGQIYAQYPNADIKYVNDYTKRENEENVFVTTGEIEMEKDYIFPIKTFMSFEVDPLAAITCLLYTSRCV